MNAIDVFVYLFLFVIAPISLYLKKTGKKFKEMVDDIIEFFKGFSGGEE